MSSIKTRKITVSVEEIWHEGGPIADVPLRKAAALAIINNPFAGRYVEDISPFMEELKPLGLMLAQKLIDVLGGAANIQGYGKGAIVGTNGEIEHGALWHVPGGYAMRELLGNAKSIVPSTKKVGSAGARLDIPVTHINASYVRGHFDAMEVGCNDGPKANELLLALVMSTGGRVHDRVGGLRAEDIQGIDGLR